MRERSSSARRHEPRHRGYPCVGMILSLTSVLPQSCLSLALLWSIVLDGGWVREGQSKGSPRGSSRVHTVGFRLVCCFGVLFWCVVLVCCFGVLFWCVVLVCCDMYAWGMEHWCPGMKKGFLAATYSPTDTLCSTIGVGRLNCRVRHGTGCDPSPMTTRNPIQLPYAPQQQNSEKSEER